jgi:signal transduction histidine kinase
MEKIDFAILIGTGFVLLLLVTSLGIILFAQKKKSEAQAKLQYLELEQEKKFAQIALQSFEEERQRIGLELHDDLGQQLSLNALNLTRVTDLKKLAPIITDIQLAISKCSNISRLMYPVVLQKFGLKAGLEQLIESLRERSHIDVRSDISTLELPYAKELMLFRIVQELINNSIKHSNCTEITLNLTNENSHSMLAYSDNGMGFDLKSNSYGLGLHSIKTRASSLSDDFNIVSAPNEGFSFQLTLY